MSQRPRSLRYEYELFVEREIENYKESIPRSAILKIGDDAVAALQSEPQLALTEILLCAEVDRIIRGRLRMPSFATWRKRRLKALKEFSRPERWGFRADSAFARAALAVAEGHVLVAGVSAEGPAIYLAANGCAVTAVEKTEDVLERVLNAAAEVGLTSRVRCVGEDLTNWLPDRPLNAVVVAAAALSGLSTVERARAIELLQQATMAGGVHVVEGSVGGESVSLDELRDRYRGWHITVERGGLGVGYGGETFLARKEVA
jgi:hypothetical protein